MYGAAKKRLMNKINEVNDGMDDAYRLYVKGRVTLLKKLRKFGEEEFSTK